jgi:hypothetical protein
LPIQRRPQSCSGAHDSPSRPLEQIGKIGVVVLPRSRTFRGDVTRTRRESIDAAKPSCPCSFGLCMEMRQQEHEIHKSIVNNEGSGDASVPCCTPESPSRLDRESAKVTDWFGTSSPRHCRKSGKDAPHTNLVGNHIFPAIAAQTHFPRPFRIGSIARPESGWDGGSTAHKSRKDTPFDAFVGCPPQEGIARW